MAVQFLTIFLNKKFLYYWYCYKFFAIVEITQIHLKQKKILQRKSNKTGEKILLQIADQLKHSDPNVVIKGGFEVMQNFKNKDILLGT